MLKTTFTLLFLLLFSSGCFAADVFWSSRLEGSGIHSSASIEVQDANYASLGFGLFTDADAQSFLRLGLKEEQTGLFYNGENMRIVVSLNIVPYSDADATLPSIAQTLEVKYMYDNGAPSVDAEDFRMPGIHKFTASITSVTVYHSDGSVYSGAVPNYIYLEGGFSSRRYFKLNTTQLPDISRNFIEYQPDGTPTSVFNPPFTAETIASTDELELTWDYVAGAEYYDLEWCWVDNYSENSVLDKRPRTEISLTEQEFEHNSTRIRTSAQSYRIPQIFGRGYLIYRVRGVGRWETAPEQDKYGRWSSDTPILKENAGNWPDWIVIGAEHEAGKNWQYQSTYAEEGKKKEVAQYFDGSLRGRQTVTRINSDNKSVVGETIYDNEGRGVIQILPVPQINPAIQYYPSLNKNEALAPYSHRDFDWEDPNANCVAVPAAPLEETTGAGNYYSTAAHATETDWQRNVPDAQGYPYTQVEYTPDNTGRIRNQSGVGETHQIGGGKETYYYYLQPSQEELNRLFGYKVGFKTRYKKNMVVDANGQVSVSYLDAQGRVIATALAGDGPGALDGLEAEAGPGHEVVSTDLLGKLIQADKDTPLDDNNPYSTGRFGAVNDGLEMGTQIGVVKDGTVYNFEYNAKSEHYQAEDCGETPGQTFPFVYDLKLSLRDDCGNEKFSDVFEKLGHQEIGSVLGDEQSYISDEILLDIGSYTLFKEISINKEALDAYVAAYLDKAQNPCVLTTEDFMLPVSTDCNTTCEECAEGLGILADFLEAQREALGAVTLTTAQVAEFTNQYNGLRSACLEPCEVKTSCDAFEAMLRSDLRPMGQYGKVGADVLSVFSETNSLGGNWHTPASPYTDEYGNISLVEVQYNGTTFSPPLVPGAPTVPAFTVGQPAMLHVRPQFLLSAADFASAWKESWSLSLLHLHPEYKLYLYQTEICAAPETGMSSELFDAYFRDNIHTYAQATGTNAASIDFTDEAAEKTILWKDPYFATLYPAHEALSLSALKNALMEEALTSNYDGKNMSMLDFAIRTVLCGTDLSETCNMTGTWNSIASGTVNNGVGTVTLTTAQKDAIWLQYKSYYLSYKLKINQLLMDFHGFAQSPELYNGCIGPDAFSFQIGGSFQFSTQFASVILPTIFDLWGLSPIAPTFPVSLCGGDFDSKQIRMIRIDNLYNAGIPPLAVVAEQQAAANYAQWQQTGLCPMTASMESLLNKLGSEGWLTEEVDSDTLPELTRDLYTYLTDVTTASGRATTSADFSSGSLELRIGGDVEACTITIPQVGPYLWSDYADTWKIWGIYHSYPVPGTNDVQVIVKAGASTSGVGDAVEYVVTYTSCKNLNNCQAAYAANNMLDADCDKEEKLEASLLKLFQKLLADGHLHVDQPLSTMPEYMQSALVSHLGTSAPIWYGTHINNNITAGTNRLFLGINFPSNTVAITAVELVGNVLYTQFMTSGSPAEMVTLQSNPSYIKNGAEGSLLALSCPCEREAGLTYTAEEMLNHLLMKSTVPEGYVPPMMKNLEKYLEIKDPAIYEFENTSNVGISFALSPGKGDGNLFRLTGSFTGKLMAVSNIEIGLAGFTATGHLPSGTAVPLTGRVDGVKEEIPACDTCLAQRVAPQSCDVEYEQYLSYATANITNEMFVPVSKNNFCESQYAYISDAWAAYMTAFNIESSNDELYLSLAEFGGTPIGYSNAHLLAALDDYETYRSSSSGILKGWNEFVDHAYMKLKGICPVITDPVAFPDPGIVYPCDQWQNAVNVVNGQNQENIYLDQLAKAFTQSYIELAMSTLEETFTESHDDKEYHYTLYYYDRAGNLIQTVPPKGVKRLDQVPGDVSTNDEINAMRTNEPEEILNVEAGETRAPEHLLQTVYKYNSLNQLVFQRTPDGGESRFAYDALGRIVVSQNAKQEAVDAMSYTIYDPLERVYETGEMTEKVPYLIDDLGRLVLASSPSSVVSFTGQTWISNIAAVGSRREVTISIYDEMPQMQVTQGTGSLPATDLFSHYSKNNTRNRIVATLYQEVYNSDFNNHYDALSLYDYDVHGNVKELIQVNNDADLVDLGQHVKKMVYDYDLVSGNVKQVTYQKGRKDEFIHKYQYDSDNRITDVETSDDGFYFEKDAKYFYYAHGPLARTETGNKKVQAQDYAYTIQGWLKAVNGEEIDPNTMLGHDGQASTINSMAGRDVYGYSLSYFEHDYASAETSMLNYSETSTFMGNNLYSGNIRTMMTAVSKDDESVLGTHQTSYGYDQLNRIRTMTGHMAATQLPSGYSNSYGYDPNGNIMNQTRYSGSTVMDDFTYHYNPSNNQLDYVSDAQTNDVLFDVDIDNTQAAGNYGYDQIGQLDKDLDEDILEIKWTVTSKVKEVIYTGDRDGEKIVFDYNSMGNRIAKHATKDGITTSTYYMLDAQGNPMSIYTLRDDENNLYLSERNIYGSSRIGMEEHHLLMTSEALSNTENLVELNFNAGESSLGWPMQHNCTGASSVQANVGGKLKVTDPCATQHDLFINTVPGHRYKFSGDFDVNNSTNFFINYSLHSDGVGTYGPVITTQSLSVTTENRFTYEFIAATHWSRISLRNIGISNVVGTFTVDNIELKHWLPETAAENALTNNVAGDKRYELANHLGNVLNVVTDRKLPEESITYSGTVGYYLPDVVSYSDYDPFGMMLDGRHGSAGYRYGFNGKEKDDEFKGSDASYDYGFRIYDPRLGRFLSMDPLRDSYPWFTPYQFAGNSPVRNVDLDGLEQLDYTLFQKGMLSGETKLRLVPFPTGETGQWHPVEKYTNNPYWSTKGERELYLKQGESPTAAVFHIMNNPKDYEMECGQFVQSIIYSGMIESMGKEGFDKYMNDNAKNGQIVFEQYGSTGIKTKNKYQPAAGEWWDVANGVFTKHPDFNPRETVEGAPIGTRVIIETKVLKDTKHYNYFNENIVKIGDDQFLAQGLANGPISLQQVKSILAQFAVSAEVVKAEDVTNEWIENNIKIEEVEIFDTEIKK